MDKGTAFLRRYTNLAGVIHILQNKKITLLDPKTWDDGNDIYFMSKYAELKKAKSVSALCFAQETETYHHWRVFSPGTDGVCLDLNRDKFLAIFAGDPDVRHQRVKYEKIEVLKSSKPSADELPFLKRLPYQHEAEYRIVHTGISSKSAFPEYAIPIACINAVVLSPWMPQPLVKSVKRLLRTIPDCKTLKIYQTTVIDNAAWKGIADHSH